MRRRARSKLIRAVCMLLAVPLATTFAAAGCGGPQVASGPQQGQIGAFSATLETEPSAPISKQNVLFRLKVADEKGQAVSDVGAAVSLTMPGMNHGENVIPMSHKGDGVYEGTGIFVMAGRWAADVTLARPGEQARGRFLIRVTR